MPLGARSTFTHETTDLGAEASGVPACEARAIVVRFATGGVS
jgi:hypothetical protein